MGDLKVGEGFIDAVMIRVTATGAAAVGLVPTCTLTRLSTGARVGLTVAEVSDGIYKVTDMVPGADDEWLTEWAVAGANTIYAPYKLFKVGGGDVQDIYDLVKAAGAGDVAAILVDTGTTIPALIAALNDLAQADILSDATPFDGADIAAILADTVTINWADITTIDGLIDDIIADIGAFPTANYATLAAYVEDIRARLIVILADTNEVQASLADGGFTDLLIDAIKAKTDNLPVDPADASDIVTAHALLATEAKQDIIDTNVDDIETDTNEIQTSLADGGFTDLLIDAIKAKTDNLPVDPADASDIATAHGLLATEAKQDIIDTNVDDIETDTNEIQISLADGGFTDLLIDAIKGVVDAILVDTGTTLENRQDAMNTIIQVSQNSELFGSVMLEEVQLGAGAADVNMPNVVLPDIAGTIDRVYLHFKVRMIENEYDGPNMLAGAQSIRIKKAAGAWGVDDIPAITFVDDGIAIAALTREAGDVFGGKIDVSSEVDAFNATYNIRWEDGAVDMDFLNFNDIEMFLRVIFH